MQDMDTEVYEKQLKDFKKDTRIACQYGIECYQKNPAHHTKFKHPPKNLQKDAKAEKAVTIGRKRTSSEREDESSSASNEPPAKCKKDKEIPAEGRSHSISPSPTKDTDESDSESENDPKSSLSKDSPGKNLSEKDSSVKDLIKNGGTLTNTLENMAMEDKKGEEKMDEKNAKDIDFSSTDPKKIIRDLFLTDMPDDFYKFYDFCKILSPKDPSTSLKLVDLKLVGPYDVLNGKIAKNRCNDSEKYLRHWRYYYDPPEFQTILKGNDKEGLHYGYWRDNIEDAPIFVAKNSANKDCNIHSVAPNIFAAVNKHIADRVARANPFEKGPMLKLSKQLKTFAKDNDISLDDENPEMRNRARKVVAKTFHGAGIVVPYDKKTQLGYRDLAATDSQLKRILREIDEAETDEERRNAMVNLEEVVRWATIAADECDFGTCLELGHDLFSSGIVHVQRIGLRMLASAYNLLNRKKLLNIAEAHAKDRKKGSNLDVL